MTAALSAPVDTRPGSHPRRPDRRGSSVAAAVMVLLVLASLGVLLSAQVAGDQILAANQIQSARAFYAAEAGLEFASGRLQADPNWSGLPPPGQTVGLARFSVALADTAPDGNSLPAGQKWIIATGRSDQAVRELRLRVQLGS